VTIAATAPGIFTSDGSGAGQAAALNFSAATSAYSLNNSTTPANIGDTVLLYLTGEGNYNANPLDPAANTNDGFIIPSSLSPLPQLSPLPTVTIGGAAATVSYAGPIVGSILGLVQINAVVPTGASTGQAVPVLVTIGGNNSQANTTLSIHQ
jgi:trimeric autotransporter adhesin